METTKVFLGRRDKGDTGDCGVIEISEDYDDEISYISQLDWLMQRAASLRAELSNLGFQCTQMRNRMASMRRFIGARCEGSVGEVLVSPQSWYRPVVYGLVDPRDANRIRYVGQATKPAARYMGHMHGPGNRVKAWMLEMEEDGEAPAMVLLEDCEEGDLDVRENHWINHYKSLGQADLNHRTDMKLTRRSA